MRALIEAAAELAALGLFLACVGVWAAHLTGT
jgi:hypothetical protein